MEEIARLMVQRFGRGHGRRFAEDETIEAWYLMIYTVSGGCNLKDYQLEANIGVKYYCEVSCEYL